MKGLGVRRVAVPEAVDADTADQVDVTVPVHVLDHGALGLLDRDAGAERETLEARREMALLELDELARPGAGNFRLDVRGLERHFLAFRSR